jgi:hypothetical protein
MRRASFAAFAVLSTACSGGQYTYAGYKIYDHMPLDGARWWKYSQDDKSVEWQLQVDKVEPTEVVDDVEVVTLEHHESAGGDLLSSIKWSSDSINGVQIHAFSEAGDKETVFDPPIMVGQPQMTPDDVATTETNAGTFESTFVAVEECPNHWVSDPAWTCVHLELTGPGLPFEGNYWMAPRYGISWFQPIDYEANWNLLEASWSSENETQ